MDVNTEQHAFFVSFARKIIVHDSGIFPLQRIGFGFKVFKFFFFNGFIFFKFLFIYFFCFFKFIFNEELDKCLFFTQIKTTTHKWHDNSYYPLLQRNSQHRICAKLLTARRNFLIRLVV
jgi:hypothetical protein